MTGTIQSEQLVIQIKREENSYPASTTGEAAGSPPLLPSLRRREGEGTPVLCRFVDSCRVRILSGFVRVVAAKQRRINLPQLRFLHGGASGGVMELVDVSSRRLCGATGFGVGGRDWRDCGVDLVFPFSSPASPSARWRFLQRLREVGRSCVGVLGSAAVVLVAISAAGEQRCGAGFAREAALLEFGRWKVVGGSGFCRWRRCRCAKTPGLSSKWCGDLPRPMSHSGKRVVVRDGVFSEARLAASLPGHSLGAGLVGCLPSFPTADASATAADGIDGHAAGCCRDPEGPLCYFSFSWVLPVMLCGVLSLWCVLERSHVWCNLFRP